MRRIKFLHYFVCGCWESIWRAKVLPVTVTTVGLNWTNAVDELPS